MVSFIRVLYSDPGQSQLVTIRIVGKLYSLHELELFVNGHRCSFQAEQSTKGEWWLKCCPEFFEPWENIVLLRNVDEIADISLQAPSGASKLVLKEPTSLASKRDGRSLAWAYILSAHNTFKSSRFHGTFFAAYDLDNRSFRLNSWVWCSAIVVKALLGEYKLTGDDKHLQLAKETVKAMLRFQRQEGDEAGGIMVRWDVWPDSPIGIVPWLAPNDSAIIGSYALLPLYQATGDTKYLNAAVKIGEWILRRGMTEGGQLYVGYREDLGVWDKSWLYVDAGFTGTLFEELFWITGEARWKEALRLFIDDFIQRFGCEEGCFYRTWYAAREMDRGIFARGQGWALDGLISAYRVLKEREYLQKIMACADYLVEHQNANGSWNYMLNIEDSGECNKGTPVIAYHLLRLSELIPEATKYISSAKKALEWCEEHQYRGPDQFAVGGIHARNAEGCIVAFPNTDTIFTYGVAYYLLALNKLAEIEGRDESQGDPEKGF